MGLVAETAMQKVDVPHEDGEWFEIVPLSWADLESARRLKTDDAIKQAAMFDAETLKGIQSNSETATTSPSDGLDMATVLNAGIKRWSYNDAVSPETINRLDERTALWAFDAIATRSVMSEDEQKNGAAPQKEPF